MQLTIRWITISLLCAFVVACGSDQENAAPTTAPAEPTTAVLEEAEGTETEGNAEAETEAEGSAETESDESEDISESATSAPVMFQLDAWSDNWFAAYSGEELIVEDSVSINTERSFNAETATFEASYPLHLNFILKDFKENDTGLEYIGERNQQMGDGGFIMQLTDTSTGEVVAVSDDSFACTVIHTAPLDKSCESESNPVAGTAPCTFEDLGEPEGWLLTDFDDSVWTATTIHSASAVDPKQGYNDIIWDSSAQFIWGPDLEINNTVLCRVTVSGQ